MVLSQMGKCLLPTLWVFHEGFLSQLMQQLGHLMKIPYLAKKGKRRGRKVVQPESLHAPLTHFLLGIENP